MEDEALLNDESLQKDVNKEKRSYYARYIIKFGFIIWIPMFLYAIVSNSLTYINSFGWLPTWLISILVYGVGLIVLYALMMIVASLFDRDRVKESSEVYGFEGQKRKLGFGKFLVIFLVVIFIARIMTLIGSLLMVTSYVPVIVVKVISIMSNPSDYNYVEMMEKLNMINGMSSKFTVFLVMVDAVVLAPIFEELIFRKILMDRISKYGVSGAIIVSGLFFGLFHMNAAQFFMATMIGFIFAYVYAYTHNIVYTMLLHFVYNLSVAGFAQINSLFINDDYRTEYSGVINRFIEGLQYTTNMDSLYRKFISEITTVVTNHPVSAAFVLIDRFRGLLLILMFLAGMVLFFVFMKRFFKMRKNLKLSDKGTKRCAIFNWASILYIVAGLFGAFALYMVTNIVVLLM